MGMHNAPPMQGMPHNQQPPHMGMQNGMQNAPPMQNATQHQQNMGGPSGPAPGPPGGGGGLDLNSLQDLLAATAPLLGQGQQKQVYQQGHQQQQQSYNQGLPPQQQPPIQHTPQQQSPHQHQQMQTNMQTPMPQTLPPTNTNGCVSCLLSPLRACVHVCMPALPV
jgi:hypothetical protein